MKILIRYCNSNLLLTGSTEWDHSILDKEDVSIKSDSEIYDIVNNGPGNQFPQLKKSHKLIQQANKSDPRTNVMKEILSDLQLHNMVINLSQSF